MKGLETYICEELNVRDLVLSSDEEKYNVSYSVTADWPTLGKKFKKEAQVVKKALPGLTSADVKAFVQNKLMTLSNLTLTSEDLIVKRGLSDSSQTSHLETNTDDDVLIILDAAMYPELAEEGLAREIINRVQRLRKKAGLVPTDDVKMQYAVLSDPEGVDVEGVFERQSGTIERALRRRVDRHVVTQVDGEVGVDGEGKEDVIMEEEQEVQKATFLLRLVKL